MKRPDWLSKLVGKDTADQLQKDLTEAAETLDSAGLARKDMGQTPAQDETSADAEMLAKVGQKLAQQIFDAAKGNLSTLTQDNLAAVISDALTPVVENETTQAGNSPQDSGENRQMTDNAKDNKTDTGVGAVSTVTIPAEIEKAYRETIVSMTEDQSAMVKNIKEQGETLAGLHEQIKSLKDTVEEFARTAAELKKQLGDRPRSASAADETELDGTSEQGKALDGAIRKGVNGNKTVLGIPVKD